MKKILFIGAGASKGARESLGEKSPPLGNHLINFLHETIQNNQSVLTDLFPRPRYYEHAFERMVDFIRSNIGRNYEQALDGVIRAQSREGDLYSLVHELNRLISFSMRSSYPDFLRGLCIPVIEPHPAFANSEDLYDKLVCEKLKESWTIISLNYDILIEEALLRIGRIFWYPFIRFGHYVDSLGAAGAIEILKPHGSINWFPVACHQIGYNSVPPPSKVEIAEATSSLLSINYEGDSVQQNVLIPLFWQYYYSPIMAHYCHGKPVTSNPKLISTIRAACFERIESASEATIIGVSPVQEDDDSVAFGIFERLKGRRVNYINPSAQDCNKIRRNYGFNTIQQTLSEWLSE
jgi:hypothetical protein